jgi:hypothetical protein
MVSFSNIPYREALERGQHQNQILEILAAQHELNDEIILATALPMLS